jgi:pyrimidine operon attenuation protein/uracil phosphoribosyltransferase
MFANMDADKVVIVVDDVLQDGHLIATALQQE